MPALSLKLGFERPQDSSDRVKYGILLIGTSSVDSLSFHLNLAYDHYLKTARQEAEGAVKYAFALSYPVGGPLHARTLFILNYYLNESPVQGEANLQGMEAGLRYQWRERSVLDAGMGSEFAGPGGRSQFSASLGASYAF
jgi:hypothetical protein